MRRGRMEAHALDRILVPVDFSEISAHALKTAYFMKERCGGSVLAMYANWIEAPPYFTSSRLEELRREFRESMDLAEESLRGFVQATLGDRAVYVAIQVVEALPADGIRELTALHNADLIVMGTHGRSGLNRWKLGSVT